MNSSTLAGEGSFKRYQTIGMCIYCGDTTSKLCDEHIIPYSIAGNFIIFEQASCKKCEKLINVFEHHVMKDVLGHLRFKVGSPSRSKRRGKKSRSEVFTSEVLSGYYSSDRIFLTNKIALSKYDHPIGFIWLRLKPPKILQGISIINDDPVDGFGQTNPEMLKLLTAKNNPVVYIDKLNLILFARSIAKIAYSYAIAECGQEVFVTLVRPLLLGKRAIFTDLVGGDYDIPPPTISLHELQLFIFDAGIVKFQCVRVRLFASMGTPNYDVVVGIIKSNNPNFYEEALERQYVNPITGS